MGACDDESVYPVRDVAQNSVARPPQAPVRQHHPLQSICITSRGLCHAIIMCCTCVWVYLGGSSIDEVAVKVDIAC